MMSMTHPTHPFRKYAFVFTLALFITASWLVFPAFGWLSDTGAKTEPVLMVPAGFTGPAQNASPAVVNISTVRTVSAGGPVFHHFYRGPGGQQDPFEEFFNRFFGDLPRQEFKQKSLGSGFIMDEEGFIITNNHVIADADQIQVKLKNGKEYKAEIIGADATTDIALIRIKAEGALPALSLGDSDKLEVGQWVIAIGNPFGLEYTVTAGIISAKGRVIGAGPYDDFIQTDASINPGNSGGPLINMQGEVVGINTAIVAGGEGIGFAIPVNMAKQVVFQLKKSGKVTRGWLGVGIQDLDKELQDYYGTQKGVLVTEVFPDNPAEKAGIEANDIILSVNDREVNSSRELSQLVAGLSVGDKAEIKVNRRGKIKTFTVKIAKRDESSLTPQAQGTHGRSTDELGIRVSKLTPQIAQQFGIKDDQGVVVVDVAPDSQADQAGVKEGDLITEINHQAIKTPADYQDITNGLKKGDAVHLYIKRPLSGYLVIKLTK